MLQQYVKAPEITRTRLYLETMSEILPQTGPKIIVDESMRQLLPILPLSTKPGEGGQQWVFLTKTAKSQFVSKNSDLELG